jgi:hypothetical protein
VARAPSDDGAAMNDAVQAAKAALPAWSGASPEVRSDVLDKVGSTLLARKDELGRLLSREEGKTLAEGIGEVMVLQARSGEGPRVQQNSGLNKTFQRWFSRRQCFIDAFDLDFCPLTQGWGVAWFSFGRP